MKDLIKYINDAYVAKRDDQFWVPGIIRASSIGYDVRRIVMNYRREEYPAIPFTPRALRVFEVGDDRHHRLQNILADFPGGQFPKSKEEEEELTLDLGVPAPSWETEKIEGGNIMNPTWRIKGHIDGYAEEVEIDGRTYKKVVIDFKTANSKGWRWTCDDDVGSGYRSQAQMYMHMKGAKWHMWVFENKDTQELHPTMMPYSEQMADDLIEKAKVVAHAVNDGNDPIVDIPACSGDDYGFAVKRLAKLGMAKVANWGCSYCSNWKHCFPRGTKIRWSGKQVLFELDSDVPGGDVSVLGMGNAAIPREGWDLKEVEE